LELRERRQIWIPDSGGRNPHQREGEDEIPLSHSPLLAERRVHVEYSYIDRRPDQRREELGRRMKTLALQ
jgi:hypothetical protein